MALVLLFVSPANAVGPTSTGSASFTGSDAARVPVPTSAVAGPAASATTPGPSIASPGAPLAGPGAPLTEPGAPPPSPGESFLGLAASSDAAPGDPLYFIRLSTSHAPTLAVDALRPSAAGADGRIWGGFVNRRIKVIHYTAPIRLNQNDMVLNLDAPGAGRAILSLELKFY